ncbi:MAG TPA: histidine--tRNA ligase [Chitinophagaceae bacterium]|nr:histidine--tRNA ligase [Chitinophagaceae bacterium]MCC6634607.1 histidine--tRNA ligase [Chitinophagaceae bacterium]HMZ47006.1 histidine--tRNA ligase [Chitinophagaceae bacterium]HNE93538.1 histidine--tRNA ligase [Chitinophagaceae bacterium]HNJ57582.1 histidine--tRNA ligase [Chitinophagaceae bacterium]
MSKISLPQGTRDFSADVVRKRNYIFNTIRTVFELYGFQPLETPAMENIETLMGKYGDEGDKLIFKILNNGLDRIEKREKSAVEFQKVLEGKNNAAITERALRYDLTIPFARFVAMNHGSLTMPFKRYQIQPVWRADKPQRGRYREFYQCDCDVVGSYNLLNEVELANIYSTVFEKLSIDVEIKINSRKILAALAELCGGADKLIDITIAIDKLDKIGLDNVKEELLQRGLNKLQITTIEKYLNITGNNKEKIIALKQLIGNNETGNKGIDELEYILSFQPKVEIDFTLARGLNYYTGIIFEVKATKVQMGSIGGGGRYDDLTGDFGVPNLPGVGISFGVDRIYDVMEELKVFPDDLKTSTEVLFFNLGMNESKTSFNLMQQLRDKGVSCELYHETAKFDKQFKYADKKNIHYAVIIGSKEIEEKTCTLKNLKSGEQHSLQQNELLSFSF